MKILKLRIKGLPFDNNSEMNFDFMPEKKVKIETDDEVFELEKHIQIFNVLALYGMNSTGKTNALKLIEFAHDLYLRRSSVKELREKITGLADKIEIDVMLYNEKFIYIVNTKIQGGKIIDEVILGVSSSIIKSKKMLNEIANTNDIQRLNDIIGDNGTIYSMQSFKKYIQELEKKGNSSKVTELLYEDIYKKKSILPLSMENAFPEECNVISTVNRTNFNFFALPSLSKYPKIINKIAQLLDSNIEELTYTIDENEPTDVRIKFINRGAITFK